MDNFALTSDSEQVLNESVHPVDGLLHFLDVLRLARLLVEFNPPGDDIQGFLRS